MDEGRIERHIKPLLGRLAARDVTAADVQRLADAITEGRTAIVLKSAKMRGKTVVTGGPIAAARVVGLLGGIWSWAAKRGYVPIQSITKGVDKAKGKAKDRILSREEFAALGVALDAIGSNSPQAADAIRLLALTGMRKEEVVRLTWPEINFAGSCAQLGATKTGRSTRPLGAPVVSLLREMSARRTHDTFLFPNIRGDAPSDLKKEWL
jgi:integrase